MNMKRNILRVAVLSFLAFTLPTATFLLAQDKPATPREQSRLAKNLLGTWRGESGGAKVEIVIKADGQAKWTVSTRGAERTEATVQAELRWVEDREAATIELRFTPARATEGHPFIRMGRLTRNGNSLLLTIVSDAREQSEHYYELLTKFPLERQ